MELSLKKNLKPCMVMRVSISEELQRREKRLVESQDKGMVESEDKGMVES